MRRVIDLILALVALPIVVIVCLICAALIRLETRGNPLFIQIRVGRYEQPFRLVKLRTMFQETDDLPSHDVAVAQITRVGRFLRRTKLDELPQIWNILRGEMSFVGPRPCLPSQRALVSARAALGIYSVRPGITGPAQLAGIDMSTPELLARADAAYMRTASVRTDITLIILTLLGRGSGDAASRIKDITR